MAFPKDAPFFLDIIQYDGMVALVVSSYFFFLNANTLDHYPIISHNNEPVSVIVIVSFKGEVGFTS